MNINNHIYDTAQTNKALSYLYESLHSKYGFFTPETYSFQRVFKTLWNLSQTSDLTWYDTLLNQLELYYPGWFEIQSRYLYLFTTATDIQQIDDEFRYYQTPDMDYHVQWIRDNCPDLVKLSRRVNINKLPLSEWDYHYFASACAKHKFWYLPTHEDLTFCHSSEWKPRFQLFPSTITWTAKKSQIAASSFTNAGVSNFLDTHKANAIFVPPTQNIDLAYAENHIDYQFYIASVKNFLTNPDDFEAFVCYYQAIRTFDMIPDDNLDLLRIFSSARPDLNIISFDSEDQFMGLTQRISDAFTEQINKFTSTIALPMMIPVVCLSLVTVITSLITIIRDKSYITGSVGLIASTSTFVYSMIICFWGESRFKTMMIDTASDLNVKITNLVEAMFGKTDDTESEYEPEEFHDHIRELSHPNKYALLAETSEPDEAHIPDDSLSQPKHWTDAYDQSATSADYVKLGLSAAGILTGIGLCFASGQTTRSATDCTRLITGMSSAALTASSMYSIIATIVSDDGSERRSQIGQDLTNFHTKLLDFQKRDDSYLATTSLEKLWGQLVDQYSTLSVLVHGEDKNSSLVSHFKDVQVLYFKCATRYLQIHSTMVGVQRRVEPVFVNLYGAPGAGKSTFVNNVIKPYLCAIEDVDLVSGCIEMSGVQKYAPAFQNRPICIMDEYMQAHPDEDTIQMITNMISSTPYKCDGASIELKQQYFNAEIVLTMSNRGTFAIADNIAPASTVEAFWSRHNFFYCIRDGQQMNAGRTMTPGSKLRLFRSNGHTPSAEELEVFKRTTPDGKEFWSVPAVLPSWLIKEYSNKEFVLYIISNLVIKQNRFMEAAKSSEYIFNKVNPDSKLVIRQKIDPNFAAKFPLDSIFNENHPMRKKVDDVFDRFYDAKQEIAKLPEHVASIARRRLEETIQIDSEAISNEIPTGPTRTNGGTRLRPPNVGPRPNVPYPPLPLGQVAPGVPPPPNRPFIPDIVNGVMCYPKTTIPVNLPKPVDPFFTEARARDEMGSKPLVLHVLGKTAVGKSFTWDKWMAKMAKMYNMAYDNTHGSIPDRPKTSTIYMLDDVLPSRHEEFCQFWEKCDGSNVICTTSNMIMPKELSTPTILYYQPSLIAQLGSIPAVRDCSHFPSEKLIRRAGIGGTIYYNGNIYSVQSPMTVFEQIGRGQVVFDGKNYTEINIFSKLSAMISDFLRMETAVEWELTEVEPDFTPENYDFYCDIVPDTMHTIQTADFQKAATPLVGSDLMTIRLGAFTTWNDPAVFVTNNLVPTVMPRPQEIWNAKNAFSGIITSLLPQKKEFKLLIKIGDTKIYTTGDDVVKVKFAYDTQSTITLDDDLLIVAVKHPWETEPVLVSYDSAVILLGATPNHRADIGTPETRHTLMSNRAKLLESPYLYSRMQQLDRTLYYQRMRENAKSDYSKIKQWIEAHPLISIVVGSVATAGALYYGAKLIGKLFTNDTSCAATGCDKIHVRLSHWTLESQKQETAPKWYHNLEDASKDWPYLPLAPNDAIWMDKHDPIYCEGMTHMTAHNAILRDFAVHRHQCKCGETIWHSHKIKKSHIHTPEICPKCNPAVDQAFKIGAPKKGRNRRQRDYSPDANPDWRDKTYGTRKTVKHWAAPADKPFQPPTNMPTWYNDSKLDWSSPHSQPGSWADEMKTFITPICFNATDEGLMNTNQPRPTAMTGVERKITTNLVYVSTKLGLVKGLMLAGDIGITVAHVSKIGDIVDIESDEFNGQAKVIMSYAERDISYFQLINSKHSFKDIRKYFASEELITACSDIKVHFPRDEGYVTVLGSGEYLKTFEYYSTNGKNVREHRVAVSYMQVSQMISENGDCGTPYYLASPRFESTPIVGIHCTVQKSWRRSVIVAVTREDINEFYAEYLNAEDQSEDIFYDCPESVEEIFADNLMGAKFMCDSKTYDDLYTNLKTDRTTYIHDVGIPTKCFPIGFNDTLAMPAGFTKPIHSIAPWADKILEVGFTNDCLPAASSPRSMDPEYVDALNVDNKGYPSIVATKMAAANGPIGKELDPGLRSMVQDELADHYYDQIIRFGGFRFLNTHEVINGIRNPSDPLSGVMPMELDASPGIYYIKHFSIHKKRELFTDTGPNNTGFADTPAGRNLRSRYNKACEMSDKGKTLIDMANVKLKNELRPIEKVRNGSTRAFECEGTISYMMLKRAFGGCFEAMTKSRHNLHCTVGFDSRMEAGIYYEKFTRHPWVFGRDHKTFDKTLNEGLFEDLRQIFIRMFKRAQSEGFIDIDTTTMTNRLTDGFARIAYSIENLEGTILALKGCVNSGIYGTCHIDSLIVDLTTVYAVKIIVADNYQKMNPRELEMVGSYPTLRNILEHMNWICNGDDNLCCVSDAYAETVNFTATRDVLYDNFGILCTPPSKTMEDYNFGTLETESFCSHFFVGKYPFVTWALKKQSIERQLFWTANPDPDEIYSQMVYGVMEAAVAWQDEDYYGKIRQAVRIILRYVGKPDDTISYHLALQREMERVGLLTLSGRSPLNSETRLENLLSERKEFISKHTNAKMVYKVCKHCKNECNCQVAYWKHVANSHPTEFPKTIQCEYCNKQLGLNEYKTHEHPVQQCKMPGCVAKPKNLASMSYHAASHQSTIRQCFLSEGSDQMAPKKQPNTVCPSRPVQTSGINFDSYRYNEALKGIAHSLIEIHLYGAAALAEALKRPVYIYGETESSEETPWKEGCYEIPNTGSRRIAYRGDSIETMTAAGYFSKTLETQPENISEIIYEVASDLNLVYGKSFLDGYSFIFEGSTIMIAPISDDQMSSMQFGMPGIEAAPGTMTTMSSAANSGAIQTMAVKAPPGIIDSTNTIASALNFNTTGADPSMLLIGGRTDDLKSSALMQKTLLKSFDVQTTTAANSLIANIRYGAAAGRLAEWMTLHTQFGGSFKYEIQIVGNGALTGSIAACWYHDNGTGVAAPTPAEPTFYDVNFATFSVNQSSSQIFILNDARSAEFYRTTAKWDKNGVKGEAPAIALFVKDQIRNPMGAESSVSVNIYVSAGDDFICVRPVMPVPPTPNGMVKAGEAPLEILLRDFLGSDAVLYTDVNNAEAFPNAASLYRFRQKGKLTDAGCGALMSFQLPQRTANVLPKIVCGMTPNAWDTAHKGYVVDKDIEAGPVYYDEFVAYQGWSDLKIQKYQYGLRAYCCGKVPVNDTNAFVQACNGSMSYHRTTTASSNLPLKVVADGILGGFMANERYMITESPALSGASMITMVAPRGDGKVLLSMASEHRKNWNDVITSLWGDVHYIAPTTVFGSVNYPRFPVATSPYAITLGADDYVMTVDAFAPVHTIASAPNKGWYDLLDYIREHFPHTDTSFDLMDTRTDAVYGKFVYSWNTGVVYGSRSAAMSIYNYCSVPTEFLRIKNFLPTTGATAPPPIRGDVFNDRILRTTNGKAQRDNHDQIRASLEMYAQNPIYEEDEPERNPDDDDLDDNCIYAGDDQMLGKPTALNFARSQLGDHLHGAHGNSRTPLTLEQRQMRAELRDDIQIDQDIRRAGIIKDYDVEASRSEAGDKDRFMKESAQDKTLAHQDEQQNRLLNHQTITQGENLSHSSAMQTNNFANQNQMQDKNLAHQSQTQGTDLAAKNRMLNKELITKMKMQDRALSSSSDIQEKRLAHDKTVHSDMMAHRTAQAEAQARSAYNPTNAQGTPFAPHSAAGGMISGGLAVAGGLAGVAGGIAGMVYAGKEFGLKQDMARDAMKMQQNDHAAAFNKGLMENSMRNAAAMSNMAGMNENLRGQFRLAGTPMGGDYTSNV